MLARGGPGREADPGGDDPPRAGGQGAAAGAPGRAGRQGLRPRPHSRPARPGPAAHRARGRGPPPPPRARGPLPSGRRRSRPDRAGRGGLPGGKGPESATPARPPASLAPLPCGRGPCPAPSSQRCHYPSRSPLAPRPSAGAATAGDGQRRGPAPFRAAAAPLPHPPRCAPPRRRPRALPAGDRMGGGRRVPAHRHFPTPPPPPEERALVQPTLRQARAAVLPRSGPAAGLTAHVPSGPRARAAPPSAAVPLPRMRAALPPGATAGLKWSRGGRAGSRRDAVAQAALPIACAASQVPGRPKPWAGSFPRARAVLGPQGSV